MKTRWKLLLGMGPQASELGERDMTVCHDSNHSLMTLTQPNHTYFSVFFKLDKEHSWPKQQRYTEQEAEAAAASVADHPVSDSMVFGELWKKRDRAALIGVEEGVLDHWYDGRIVLAGDCVHKVRQFPLFSTCNYLFSQAPRSSLISHPDDPQHRPRRQHGSRVCRRTVQPSTIDARLPAGCET